MSGTLPVALWFVLNVMRPDLLAPMLGHSFGYIITVAEALLTLLGLLAYLVSLRNDNLPDAASI